jgi:hypothetical protein
VLFSIVCTLILAHHCHVNGEKISAVDHNVDGKDAPAANGASVRFWLKAVLQRAEKLTRMSCSLWHGTLVVARHYPQLVDSMSWCLYRNV